MGGASGGVEGVAELKSGQFQCMQLKLLALDLDAVQGFLADQVAQAPQLLTGAPLVLDVATASLPEAAQLRDLVERARFCGVRPIAVAADSDSELALLAESAGLPALAPDRRKGRRLKVAAAPAAPDGEAQVPAAQPTSVTTPPAEPLAGPAAANPEPAVVVQTVPAVPMFQQAPVRSGQQVYARGCDLVLTAMVSAGAEVIADGSIHVYGRLSGKALAGARGDREARIYCLAFDAELVSIAGHFRVFEAVPAELKGRACQLWLNGDKLEIQPL
jgi:septum site-determining protein MinC